MGCDIHTWVEVRQEGEWHRVEKAIFPGWREPSKEPFDCRNYGVFGFLADVRNYSCVVPLDQPRGWPPSFGKEWEFGDLHSCSWFLLSELLAVDYEQLILDWRVMRDGNGAAKARSREEAKEIKLGEFLGDTYMKSLEALKTLGSPENVRVIFAFDN